MKYYFQLQSKGDDTTFPHGKWATTPAHSIDLPHRKEAAQLARQMASLFNAEVRVSDNANLNGGDYFSVLKAPVKL